MDALLILVVLVVFVFLLSYNSIFKNRQSPQVAEQVGQSGAAGISVVSSEGSSGEVQVTSEKPIPKISSIATTESYDGGVVVETDNQVEPKANTQSTEVVVRQNLLVGISLNVASTEKLTSIGTGGKHYVIFTADQKPVFEILVQTSGLQAPLELKNALMLLPGNLQETNFSGVAAYELNSQEAKTTVITRQDRVIYLVDYTKGQIPRQVVLSD